MFKILLFLIASSVSVSTFGVISPNSINPGVFAASAAEDDPPAGPGDAEAFTDSFTDTNGTALSAHTADTSETWTVGGGSDRIDIESNAAVADSVGEGYYYSSDTTDVDYVDFSIQITAGGQTTVGPCLRMSTSGNGYCLRWASGNYEIWDTNDIGGGALLQVAASNPTSATDVRFHVTGTTLAIDIDIDGDDGSVVDATYSTGRSGMGCIFADTDHDRQILSATWGVKE